jgi:GNAT superfamily N-acetyltransferase
VTLRKADSTDIAGMRRVRGAVRENVLSDPGRITDSDYLAALEELGCSWVVEEDGEIVAFATAYRSGNIWALFVHPDHEGRGHGTALHSIVVAWLRSLGHRRIWLTTGAGTRAQQFYLSRSWEVCGTVSGGDVRLELGEA